MLAGVVIITLTVALMFFLMFFSWKISRVTKEIIFPEDKPQTESAKQVQSHISSFDRFPSSTLHTTKGKTPIFDLLTVSEDKKFEGPKHYDMHEKVLVIASASSWSIPGLMHTSFRVTVILRSDGERRPWMHCGRGP